MRTTAILSAALLGLLPLAVSAQQQQDQAPAQRLNVRIPPDYRGLTPEDMKSYCFWAGQPYSIGATFCSRQQTQTTCVAGASGGRPVWANKDNDKFCDRNPSLTPD